MELMSKATKVGKFAVALSLFGGVIFSSTPKVENDQLPPVVERFLKDFVKGLKPTLGNGALTFKGKVINKCQTLLKEVVYSGTKGNLLAQQMVITNGEKPVFGAVIDNLTSEEGNEIFKLRELTLTANENSVTITLRGAKDFKDKTLTGELSEGFITLFLGKNSLFLTSKGLINIPALKGGYRYVSLEGGTYAEPATERGNLFLSGTFEGVGAVQLEIHLGNVKPQLLERLKEAANSGDMEPINNSTLTEVVPESLLLRVEFGGDLKRELTKDVELKRELKAYISQNETVGDFARALNEVLNGKADGIKVEVVNKLGLNIAQIVGFTTLLSLAKDESQMEELLKEYFDIKISTF